MMNQPRVRLALAGVAFAWVLFTGTARAQTPAEFDRLLDGLPVIDEIDPAVQGPVHEFPEAASRVATVLGARPECSLPATARR